MYRVFNRVHVHFVWATWDRLPLLVDEAVRRAVHACIAAQCKELSCEPLAVGGVEDHVHLLAGLYQTVAMSDLVGDVKGASSHLANHEYRVDPELRWQRGYSAVSVSPSAVGRVRSYILSQPEHHRDRSLIDTLEDLGAPAGADDARRG
jgi:REP element-mobilizing transposase RayT